MIDHFGVLLENASKDSRSTEISNAILHLSIQRLASKISFIVTMWAAIDQEPVSGVASLGKTH